MKDDGEIAREVEGEFGGTVGSDYWDGGGLLSQEAV